MKTINHQIRIYNVKVKSLRPFLHHYNSKILQ